MGFLDGILNNPAVQNLAFGKIKELIKEKGLDFILVRVDDQDEIVIDLYDKGEAYIVPLDSPAGMLVAPVITADPTTLKSTKQVVEGLTNADA